MFTEQFQQISLFLCGSSTMLADHLIKGIQRQFFGALRQNLFRLSIQPQILRGLHHMPIQFLRRPGDFPLILTAHLLHTKSLFFRFNFIGFLFQYFHQIQVFYPYSHYSTCTVKAQLNTPLAGSISMPSFSGSSPSKSS